MTIEEHIGRLLIVEDDEDLGHLLAAYLNNRGYEAVHISNPTEAFKTIRDGSFDLCILDVVMPNLDGLGFCKVVKDKRPDIQFVMITGEEKSIENFVEIFEFGVDYFISKPIQVGKVVSFLMKINHKFDR